MMKYLIPVVFLFIYQAGFAQMASSGTSLCKEIGDCDYEGITLVVPAKRMTTDHTVQNTQLKTNENTEGQMSAVSKKSTVKQAGQSRSSPQERKLPGNLPIEFLQSNRVDFHATDGLVGMPEKPSGIPLAGMKSSDTFEAFLEQAITATESVKSPIRVRITSGPFKGAYLLGEASLDKDLRGRVLLEFNRLKLLNRDLIYKVKAIGLSPNGEMGLMGEYHSDEMLFFAGEFLAAGAAGYADATVQRTQTAFGTFQNAPTVDTAAKLGLVNAASKSADRLAEKSRNSPGYATVKAKQSILVIIVDDPIEG